MSGLQEYKVLAKAHGREHLVEYAKQNGVYWEESKEEGVNWLRMSSALVRHLENQKPFYTDNLTPENAQKMIEMYEKLIREHQKTMIPLLRSAMQKVYEDGDDKVSSPTDKLEEAHVHLAAYGGATWARKIFTLRAMNQEVAYLRERVESMEIPQQGE